MIVVIGRTFEKRNRQLPAVGFQRADHSAQALNVEVAKSRCFAQNRMATHKNAPLSPKGRGAIRPVSGRAIWFFSIGSFGATG
jgi:hypothetical protein